jgi:hypothetical protein
MWRPWSRPLEWLGRMRLGWTTGTRIRVGDPGSVDARGGSRWQAFRSAERLFDVWAPVPGSPWVPFHALPLFAALDRINDSEIGPTPANAGHGGFALPPHARPGASAPAWAGPGTWIVLDLPGPATVEAAVWLITSAGCQPVCTFDNWPHPKGLLRPEATLAELIRWASTLEDTRELLAADAAPLWICDSERLGARKGKPGEFDNRYFFDDSSAPGPALLRRAGIQSAIYVSAPGQDVPVLDMEGFLTELLAAGFAVAHVDVTDPSLTPRPFVAPAQPRKVPDDFQRSAAGGFGSEVPQPSSGGGG